MTQGDTKVFALLVRTNTITPSLEIRIYLHLHNFRTISSPLRCQRFKIKCSRQSSRSSSSGWVKFKLRCSWKGNKVCEVQWCENTKSSPVLLKSSLTGVTTAVTDYILYKIINKNISKCRGCFCIFCQAAEGWKDWSWVGSVFNQLY